MKPKGISDVLNKLSKSRRRSEETDFDNTTQSAREQQQILYPHRLPTLVSNLAYHNVYRLNQEAQDYQIVHGGFLKTVNQISDHLSASGHTVGISLHPSSFPQSLFQEACDLQVIFQQLYLAVSLNSHWLEETVRDLIRSDPLVKLLWSVWESTKRNGPKQRKRISAGIFRSDYMIHVHADGHLQLKQVEFNTVACAGASHGQRVADMHQHLDRAGAYASLHSDASHAQSSRSKLNIPKGNNVVGIGDMLESMHSSYLQHYHMPPRDEQSKICVLMVVQPHNFNIADERPVEYNLWSREPSIPCFRIEWGKDLLNSTDLSPSGSLHFRPAHLDEMYEVSVVYFRAGFEPSEYEERIGYEGRVKLELSNAVMCPNILTQLTGLKKVQQALCVPGALEQFVKPEDAQRLRQTFMQMYPLDASEMGTEGKRLGTSHDQSMNYVLKPSREGGGHNVFRDNINSFLTQLPQDRWAEFVLMELISPVVSTNVLVSTRGLWIGDVVAELGIWGGCVWQHEENSVDTLENRQIGWSVRSKNPNIDELSVVKGFGCFDAVTLVEDQAVRVEAD